MRDCNAARSTKAKEQMSRCTSIWIVTQICRAVSDQTVKELLGDSLKLQIQMDGLASSATVICTKVDDCQPSEVMDVLDLDEKISMMEAEKEATVKRRAELLDITKQERIDLVTLKTTVDELEVELDNWDLALSQVERGESVLPPINPMKRKQPRRSFFKRQKTGTREDEAAVSQSEPEQTMPYKFPLDPAIKPGQVLDMAGTQRQIQLLTSTAEDTAADFERRETGVAEFEKEIDTIDNKLKAFPTAKSICIKARNDFAKQRIWTDFEAEFKNRQGLGGFYRSIANVIISAVPTCRIKLTRTATSRRPRQHSFPCSA